MQTLESMEQAWDVRPPKVLVLDRGGELAREVARAAAGVHPQPQIMRLSRTTRAGEVTKTEAVDVVLAGPSELTATGLRRLAKLHHANPRTVIVLSPNARPIPLEHATACGASDVLHWPAHIQRVRNVLQKALDAAAMLHTTGTVTVVREPAPASPELKLGQVVTVTSATGGCGKTFYATNFAGYLAKATVGGGAPARPRGARVLLVDLDLQFGEVSAALRLRPERTIIDLLEGDGLPEERLAEAVMPHEAGYDVLCAPSDPISSERVGPRETAEILALARQRYDWVVVDTPAAINDIVLSAFDVSGALVVMATMDVPSLKNMSVFLRTLDRLKIPATGISLVLNKAESGVGIELDQVVKLYPQGFVSVLPYAKEVSRSINVGMPVVFSEPGSEVSRRFVTGAMKIVAPADGVDVSWTGDPRSPGPISRLIARLRTRNKEKGEQS